MPGAGALDEISHAPQVELHGLRCPPDPCSVLQVTDEMLLAAAVALADYVSPERLDAGNIYPELADLREISPVVRHLKSIVLRLWLLCVTVRCTQPSSRAQAGPSRTISRAERTDKFLPSQESESCHIQCTWAPSAAARCSPVAAGRQGRQRVPRGLQCACMHACRAGAETQPHHQITACVCSWYMQQLQDHLCAEHERPCSGSQGLT